MSSNDHSHIRETAQRWLRSHATPGTIYRIEKVDGTGPWENSDAPGIDQHNYRAGCGCSIYNPPGPHSDGGIRKAWQHVELGWGWRESPYLFGFLSEYQMRQWFCINARRSLAARGYRVAVYKAERTFAGGAQVVFDKRQAERVGHVAIYNRSEQHD